MIVHALSRHSSSFFSLGLSYRPQQHRDGHVLGEGQCLNIFGLWWDIQITGTVLLWWTETERSAAVAHPQVLSWEQTFVLRISISTASSAEARPSIDSHFVLAVYRTFAHARFWETWSVLALEQSLLPGFCLPRGQLPSTTGTLRRTDFKL